MPETAAYPTDEQILEIDNSPQVSSESAEASESTAPVETQSEEGSEETQLRPEQAKPETLTQPKPQDKTQQPTKQQTDKPATTPEQAQETIAAKAAELDRADEAFANGDVAGMAETFEQMFGENPAACADALWMGVRFLEQRAPDQFADFSRMVVADQLAQQGVWSTIEKIAEALGKSGDRATFAELNKLAAIFRQNYGLGPSTPESQAAELQNYTRQIGSMMDRSVPAIIRSAFGERFSTVQPADQQELLTAARFAIRDALSKDAALGAAMQKLAKGYSVKEGVRIYLDVIEPRLRSIIPRIAQNLSNQHAELFKAPAIPARPQASKPAQPAKPAIEPPRSMAEARARGMSLADILKETEGEIANGSFLTQEDANSMGDMDILSSQRIPQHKKPWRPESVFDEATS